MEFFTKAKAVRLRSQHNKFLVAAEDEETVKQSRSGSSKNARWSVELVDNKPNVIRLKNCQSWKYLRATDDPYLLGMTGRRVSQSSPRTRLDPTVEWEPIKEGNYVKLRTRMGNFLRANDGIPPWKNSITHDVPSRTSTQDWVLWAVDVLEVDDYESTVEEQGSLSRTSSTSSSVSKADYHENGSSTGVGASSKHATSVRPPVDQAKQSYQDHSDSLSRNSSSGSTVSNPEHDKECSENEAVSHAPPKSVRSVRRHPAAQLPSQSPKASPKSSEKPPRTSPFGQHLRDESQHSDSFNKLKTLLDGIEDLLDDDEKSDSPSDEDSEPIVESTSLHKPHALEVKMAKHTLNELMVLDYGTILSSGKEKKLEEAVIVVVADVKMSVWSHVPDELTNLGARIKSMKKDHDSATQDLEEYTTFSIRRIEMKAELKKDASKAYELESLEVGLSNKIADARATREELLKQLEEVENSIKATEKAREDNVVKLDELMSRIGEKSVSLREMERKEKSWQARKLKAERKLESVEEDWAKLQSLFEDDV